MKGGLQPRGRHRESRVQKNENRIANSYNRPGKTMKTKPVLLCHFLLGFRLGP